jgi:hypothetical protein
MRLCDRAAIVVCLDAVTGLVYFIMFIAVGQAAVLEARHTKIGPIPIARQIEILKPSDCRIGKIGVHNVLNFARCQGIVAFDRTVTERFFGIGGDDWGNNQSWAGCRIHRVSTEARKPFVGSLHSVFADEHLTCHSTTYCRRLSVVDPINIHPHLFVGDDIGSKFSHIVFEGPDIWSLVNLKLFAVIVDAFAGKSSLPISDSGINNNCKKRKSFEPNFMGFTCPVFRMFGLVCGCILAAFGIVSLFFIWGKIGKYSAAHMNVMLAFGVLLSTGFIWLGQWMLFSVFGLMP